jgi:hypothetical protein
MLKVKYGNRFVKYKMQVARVIFGFGSGRVAHDIRARAKLPSGRIGSGKILKFRPVQTSTSDF